MFCFYNSLLLLFSNGLLLCGGLSGENFSVEGFHLSFESELLSRFSYGFRNGICHGLRFGLNNCLLLLRGSSGCKGSGESCNLGHSSCYATGFGNAFLLSLNNCLLLLFNNGLLFCRGISSEKFSVESIHLCFESALLRCLTLANLCGLNHGILFGFDNCLLFCSCACCEQGSIKGGNFCAERFIVRSIVGDTLLFRFYNGLLLLFNNGCLFFGSSCRFISGIKCSHFSFEFVLLCRLASFDFCRLFGFGHSLLFCNDDSLLFIGSISGSKGSIECGNFCCGCIVICKNALFLSFDNGLLLLFNDSFLLFGGLSIKQSGIKCSHFSFEAILLLGLCLCGGTNHCLSFGANYRKLSLRCFSCLISGIESGNFCIELIGNCFLFSALLLGFNDCFGFLLDNSFFLILGFSSSKLGTKSVQLILEHNLFFGEGGSLFRCFEHGFLFGLNDSVLFLGSRCFGKHFVKGKNFFLNQFGRIALLGALFLCLDNSLLLNFKDSFLFIIGLGISQSGVEGVHIRLELHLLCGLHGCTGRLEHCALFCLDDSLLFCRSSCRLHCSIEFNDFGIGNTGSSGVGSKNLSLGFNDSLLFCGSGCSGKSGIERHNVSAKLSFLLIGSHSSDTIASLLICNGRSHVSLSGSSGCFKSLLFNSNFSLFFTFKLSIDLSFGKNSLQVFLFFGSLSSFQSHVKSHNICLNSRHSCSTLVGFLLEFCSFFFFLLLFLDIKFDLLATVSGCSKLFTLISIHQLFCFCSSIVCKHGDNCSVISVINQLIFIFFSNFGLNFNIDLCICRGLLITVHQHVLDTANDVGRVVDKVCNNLYRGKLFRRHGDHIHLTLGGDGQKANGNYANTGSTNTAKVFLSALNCNFCGQIQATCGNTHRKLGNRNNHHTARGNNLLTDNGVRINNGAYLFQRISDYFLDRRFVFHNE